MSRCGRAGWRHRSPRSACSASGAFRYWATPGFPSFTMIDWRYRFGRGPPRNTGWTSGLYSLGASGGAPLAPDSAGGAVSELRHRSGGRHRRPGAEHCLRLIPCSTPSVHPSTDYLPLAIPGVLPFLNPPPHERRLDSALFRSFWLAGFESACHINAPRRAYST